MFYQLGRQQWDPHIFGNGNAGEALKRTHCVQIIENQGERLRKNLWNKTVLCVLEERFLKKAAQTQQKKGGGKEGGRSRAQRLLDRIRTTRLLRRIDPHAPVPICG